MSAVRPIVTIKNENEDEVEITYAGLVGTNGEPAPLSIIVSPYFDTETFELNFVIYANSGMTMELRHGDDFDVKFHDIAQPYDVPTEEEIPMCDCEFCSPTDEEEEDCGCDWDFDDEEDELEEWKNNGGKCILGPDCEWCKENEKDNTYPFSNCEIGSCGICDYIAKQDAA